MPLEVGKPVFDSSMRAHSFEISGCSPFEYTTTVTDSFEVERCAPAISRFIKEFIEQASKYFSKPLTEEVFLARTEHTYEGEENSSGDRLKVSWIPAFVLFYPTRYIIHWRLISTESLPGEHSSFIVPSATGTAISPVTGSTWKKRIRRARLRAATAKLHLEKLTERYYAHYGNFDGLEDSESELSSEEEAN
jgi:hypothetical protein